MRLWIESAHECLPGAGKAVCADAARTFQTEDRFCAILVGGPRGGAECEEKAAQIADEMAGLLEQRASLETVVETTLVTLPQGEHVPFAILQILGGGQTHVVECDAPPLFLVQDGQPVLLPVVEEESHGRLIRECHFRLDDGDHLAMVSEGYLLPWEPRWSWANIAVAVRRWTDTNCSAKELLGALVSTYHRLKSDRPEQDVTVVAMHVRLARSATVWTGPPVDPAQDLVALEKLVAERGKRIICGDTTAEIAARLLGVELTMESRPDHGWLEVPPTSLVEGVDLATEGLVTMGKARERMAGAGHVRDLPRREDGATRLARALLWADRIHFLVGLAVNPAQTDEAGDPLRRAVVEGLMEDLEARGKIISVEYF
jgi:hypothetical protein